MILSMRSCFATSWLGAVGSFAVLGMCAVACVKSEDPEGGASSSSGNSSSGSTSSSGGTSSGGTSGGTSGAASSGNPAKPSKVNTTSEAIEVDGMTRRYLLQVPKTYAASKSYPLIMALHGDGENATGFSQTLPIAEFSGDDAIIAYTEGSEDLFTDYATNRDQRMVEVIIDALKKKYANIDANKVWGAGYSKGAYQLNQLACRKPGLLKAMAIHAGGAPQDRNGDDSINCPTAIGIAAFVTHGGNDDPNGGKFGADYWANLAGCQENMSASTPTICEKYNGCPAGKQVSFCVVPNQPHSPMYKDAAEHTWNWFKTL
jgi:polyhydroxybutyrate depolymerase